MDGKEWARVSNVQGLDAESKKIFTAFTAIEIFRQIPTLSSDVEHSSYLCGF